MEMEQLRLVVPELAAKLTGSRVAKIHQPAAELFVFRLWNGQGTHRLLISTSAERSSIHLTDQSFANPSTPPRFCQLLRARLSRILSVEQVNGERIVQIDASGRHGLCRLMVELIDHRANLILVGEDGRIIDSLRRKEKGQDARQLHAGAVYRQPKKHLRRNEGNFATSYQVQEGRHSGKSVGELHRQSEELGGDTAIKTQLKKIIQREKKKLKRRLINIEKEVQQQKDYENDRQHGELLLSNLAQLRRGMSSVIVLNYYQDPPVEMSLDLDARLGPQENAERYFQKYKKARRGLEHSARRLGETETDLEWLEQLEYQLETSLQAEEIVVLADELRSAGLLKDDASRFPRRNKRNAKDAPYSETTSPSGHRVLWGKNSRQNDYLSTKVLKKGDLWFHVHRSPGSHVVLKCSAELGGFAEGDILFAASLAAGYSRARYDHRVEVMLVEPNFLRKPKGAKPGMVTVQRHKIIIVQPVRLDGE